MKSGTASERAYDKAYKQAQENPNSKKHQQGLKEAKQSGGPIGRAFKRGSNNAQGKN